MRLVFLFFLWPGWLCGQGLKLNDARYNGLPQKRSGEAIRPLPPRVDLSRYVPTVINQGRDGTCVAISVGYYMRTMLEAIRRGLTHRRQIDQLRLSPAYLYNAVKDQTDSACADGIDAGLALEWIKQNGLPSLADFSFPNCRPPIALPAQANSRLLDYVKLFSITDSEVEKIYATKKTLSEVSPVVVGVQTTASMKNLAFSRSFIPRLQAFASVLTPGDNANVRSGFTRWRPERADALSFGHALCVVGYDDMLFGTGAFKLVNSWGSSWGDGGYFWLTYPDFARFTKYGYQAYVPPANDRSGITLSVDLTLSLGALISSGAVPFRRVANTPTLTAYSISQPQRTGTPYQFAASVSRPTYLYLITATAADTIAIRLFPEPGFTPLISPNTHIELPKDSLLVLRGKPGLEYGLFLFSGSEIPIDDYVRKINSQKGPFPNRVRLAFGDALMPAGQISYKEKKMGFFLRRPYKGLVVPLLVTINHVR